MRMKSCFTCGRVHPINTECPKRRDNIRAYTKDYSKRNKKKDIRSSTRWTNKSIEIRERDSYICQLCVRKIDMLEGMKQYNYNAGIQVHHIIKVIDNEDLVFENSNLITLCRYHHELVEDNKKYTNILKRIAAEQEQGV